MENLHTREAEVSSSVVSPKIVDAKMRKRDEARDETLAKMGTQLELIGKYVMGAGGKSVNVVGTQGHTQFVMADMMRSVSTWGVKWGPW
ncbi:hypothetical protein HAX54_006088, partial [Datura stramonium]|nr:hypothetical protein [Datura stramonium]